MDNDLINRSDLLNAKPEFLNEKVVRDTKYQTTKDRIYAKAWNACNDCWINTIDNAPTVEPEVYMTAKDYNLYLEGYKQGRKDFGRPQGKWIPVSERLPIRNGVYNVTRIIEGTRIIDASYFDGQDTWHRDVCVNHGRPYLNDVIAWQPRPEPYKKGGAE